jgi:hypothetical protein
MPSSTLILVLNDWGSGVDSKSSDLAQECTRIYASNRVLKERERAGFARLKGWKPMKVDDYQAAIRTVFALLNPAAMTAINDSSSNDELQQFWKWAFGTNPVWTQMIEAVERCDVNEMIRLVELIVPPDTATTATSGPLKVTRIHSMTAHDDDNNNDNDNDNDNDY